MSRIKRNKNEIHSCVKKQRKQKLNSFLNQETNETKTKFVLMSRNNAWWIWTRDGFGRVMDLDAWWIWTRDGCGHVMDPARCMRDLSADDIRGLDPIHPREEIYNMIADGVLTVEKTCGSGQKKRKFAQADNTTSQGGHPARAGHHWQGSRSNIERNDINWRGGRGYSPGAGGGHSHGRGGGGGPDNWSRPERMPRGGRGRPRGGRYRW